MKTECINSFYKATEDVFHLMFDLNVEKGDFKIVDGLISNRNANVVLGVKGDLKGSILFSFNKDMTLEMVRIMSGLELKAIDSFVSSALGEVANIIGGNALTNLTNYNYICDLEPPQVIIGECSSLPITNEKIMLIPIKTDIGDFDINICLLENKRNN